MKGVINSKHLILIVSFGCLVSCTPDKHQPVTKDLDQVATSDQSEQHPNRIQYPLSVKYTLENGQTGEQTVMGHYPSFEEVKCEGKKLQLKVKVDQGKLVAMEQELDEYDEFNQFAISAIKLLNVEFPEETVGYASVDFSILSGNDETVLQGANELHNNGEFAQAMMALDGLTDAAAGTTCVLYLKAKITNELEEFGASIELLTQALLLSPQNDNLLYSRAHRYNKAGQVELALNDLDASRAIEPTHYEIYYLYDKIYSDMGDYVQAIKYSSLGLDYRFDDYFYNLRGWNYFMNDNIELSKLDFIKAIELNPDDPNSHEGLTKILINLEQYDQALVSINKAIELDGPNTYRLNELGFIYDELGKIDKAMEMYYQVIGDWEPNSTTYNNLGWLHLYNRRFDEAIKVYQEAIKKGLDSEILYNNLGTSYLQKTRYRDAINSFQTAIEMSNETSVFAHAGVASARIKMGELDDALTGIQLINETNPDYHDSLHYKWSLDATPFELLLNELESAAQNENRTDIIIEVEQIREGLE